MKLLGVEMTDTPCPVCICLWKASKIPARFVMPMAKGAWAPLSDGTIARWLEKRTPDPFARRDNDLSRRPTTVLPPAKPVKYICHDCGAAETLLRFTTALTFDMARIATGNDREEQFRLPGAPMGLVGKGIMRPCEQGDLTRIVYWRAMQGIEDQ